MRSIPLILMLACAPALADAEFRTGNDFVRITARPCKDEKVLAAIAGHGRNHLDFRAASARVAGQDYAACWTLMGQAAYLIYEDADQGIIPQGDLKPVPEA